MEIGAFLGRYLLVRDGIHLHALWDEILEGVASFNLAIGSLRISRWVTLLPHLSRLFCSIRFQKGPGIFSIPAGTILSAHGFRGSIGKLNSHAGCLGSEVLQRTAESGLTVAIVQVNSYDNEHGLTVCLLDKDPFLELP